MYKIEIATDNSAFDQDWKMEVARILKQVAMELDNGWDGDLVLRDINGNKVGLVQSSAEDNE